MRWLLESWFHLIPEPWATVVLAPLAAMCGAFIGVERESREKPAGVRTMSLVCLGACVFTLVGYTFISNTGDSGRVAAQIVTGIGFLGGGMILRGPSGIRGVTTAATVWVVAALGIVIGSGHAPAGIALMLLIVAILRTIGKWERAHFGGAREIQLAIVFDPQRGKTTLKVSHVLDENGVTQESIRQSDAGDGRVRWDIRCHLPARKKHALFFVLADMPEIYAIET